ncbi:hypothetical protein [uncultured Clostridium sp.]|nr:hypothetical protein [uncultured Clostridium sp.]
MNFIKVLASVKCGKWFKHRIHYVKGFGYRCKYCDVTKQRARLSGGIRK